MIEFRCGACQKLLRVADSNAGRVGKCPSCEEIFRVPKEPAEQPRKPGAGSTGVRQTPGRKEQPPSRQKPTRAPKEAPPVEENEDDAPIRKKRRPAEEETDTRVHKGKPPTREEAETGIRKKKRPAEEELDNVEELDDEEDERPRRRGRRDQEENEEADVRARRRGQREDEDEEDRDEDEEDRPRRKRKKRRHGSRSVGRGDRSGTVTAIAIINYVFGGLQVIMGLIIVFGGAALASFITGQASAAAGQGGPAAADIQKAGGIIAMMFSFFGFCVIIFAIPKLLAGMGVMDRRQWGRILAIVLGFLEGVVGILSLPSGMLSISYAVFVLTTLFNPKYAAEFE